MLKSFIVIGLLVLGAVVYAENTQQYSKIYLSPFYRETMAGNTNYSYTLVVNPPDNVYEVYSAIISFDVYLNPSRNFTLWVNNQSCNTKNYYVSTSYAGAGQHRIMFDCSNIITKEGVYDIVLRSSGTNGASNGWLDLTYSNKPVLKIIPHGTEYYPNQNGTIFLQVESWNNTECELDIYYPNKTMMLSSAMAFLNNSRGIYYYDFVVPSEEGIYITDALCYKPVSNASVQSYYGYNNPVFVTKGSPEAVSNYYSYGTIGLNVENCGIYWFDAPETYGDITFSEIGNIYNHRVFLYAGGTRTTQVRARFYKYNEGTNTIAFVGETAGTNYSVTSTPTAYLVNSFYSSLHLTTKEKLAIQICLKNFGGGTEYRLYFGGATNSSYQRNTTAINQSQAFEYRGTAEIHINKDNSCNYTQISSNVWSYYNRTLTDYNLTYVMSYLGQINNSINEINISINQTFGNISFFVNSTGISEDVWKKFYFYGTPSHLEEVINAVCLDNETLMKNISFGSYSRIEYEKCSNGCFNNACSSGILRLGIIFGLFFVILLIIVLMRR